LKNASKQTDEPVLLSWEMPAGRRWLYRAVACLGGIVYPISLIALILVLPSAGWYIVPAGVLWLLLAPSYLLRPFAFTASRLRVSAQGITYRLVTFGGAFQRWSGVKCLKRGPYGFAVLSADASPVGLFLHIPPDVRDKLIAILRETSNARIVGFDLETT
jgi:hypothetical protein